MEVIIDLATQFGMISSWRINGYLIKVMHCFREEIETNFASESDLLIQQILELEFTWWAMIKNDNPIGGQWSDL